VGRVEDRGLTKGEYGRLGAENRRREFRELHVNLCVIGTWTVNGVVNITTDDSSWGGCCYEEVSIT
jgi:hypothetical protein